MNTLELIELHGLLVRPGLFGRTWRAGVFKGITGHAMPQAYCWDGTEWEGETLEQAVFICVAAIRTGTLNPQRKELAIATNQP